MGDCIWSGVGCSCCIDCAAVFPAELSAVVGAELSVVVGAELSAVVGAGLASADVKVLAA